MYKVLFHIEGVELILAVSCYSLYISNCIAVDRAFPSKASWSNP